MERTQGREELMPAQEEKKDVTTAPARKAAAPQAVILAAGKGSRLGKVADGLPKCLIQVGGRTLIRHQLDALADAGVGPVLVMIGYAADLVRETVGNAADFILNPRYAATNSLHTFFLAREWIKGPVVILNSDVLADPRLLDALLQSGEDSLAYDSLSGYAREHMKVAVKDGRVANLSKELPQEGTSGENVGMIYLSRRSLDVVFHEAEKLVNADRTDAFLAEAIRASLGLIELKAVDVAGIPWTEIDSPHDLERARRELWPRIEARYTKRSGSWRARQRWRRAGLALGALVAAAALVFAGYRISAPAPVWETVAVSGVKEAPLTIDGVAHPWWRIEKEESAAVDVSGPKKVKVEIRCLMAPDSAVRAPFVAELKLDGARVDLHKGSIAADPLVSFPGSVVSEKKKMRLDLPAGRHRIEVRVIGEDSRTFLVRFRVGATGEE
jgi:L-glutamine-phosphate cytidylyltransferase